MSSENLQRFVQDDGRTMRNLLGIRRNPEAFEAALSKFSGARIAEIHLCPDLIDRSFDRAHLSTLHRHITGDVFEWAGKMRDESVTVEGEKIGPVKTMAKPGGVQFDDALDLASGFTALKQMIDITAARKMDHAGFADHAARIFTHINCMHPFREGNGRVQREFIRQYAESSGHSLDFRFTTQGRMYEDSASSDRKDCTAMIRLFEECSAPDAVQRLRGPYQAFSRKDGFQQLYFAHAYPGNPVTGTFVGKGSLEFVTQDSRTGAITVTAIDDMPADVSSKEFSFVAKTPLMQIE